MKKNFNFIRDFIEKNMASILCEPAGNMPFKYITAGSSYKGLLWDWDVYFCSLGLKQWKDRVKDYVYGSLLNFLEFQEEDGFIPYCISPVTVRNDKANKADLNSAKPILAQLTLLAYEYTADCKIFDRVYFKLKRHCLYWMKNQITRIGLLCFKTHRGSGVDNNPAVYGRPPDSSADVFLNCLMIKELDAMIKIASLLGLYDDVEIWKLDKLHLTKNLFKLWDPVDGMFYNNDVLMYIPGKVNQDVSWSVPLKFRMWTSIMPLYIKVATKEQAYRVIRHFLSRDEFRSKYGIRSMSKNEPLYNTAVSSNPSNWQGPVWIVVQWIVYKSFKNYGFHREADKLADDIISLLASDLKRTDCMHEYYHPEEGIGLIHPGFINWNTCALLFYKNEL